MSEDEMDDENVDGHEDDILDDILHDNAGHHSATVAQSEYNFPINNNTTIVHSTDHLHDRLQGLHVSDHPRLGEGQGGGGGGSPSPATAAAPPIVMSKKTYLVTWGPLASTLELQLEMMTMRLAMVPSPPSTCTKDLVCNSLRSTTRHQVSIKVTLTSTFTVLVRQMTILRTIDNPEYRGSIGRNGPL